MCSKKVIVLNTTNRVRNFLTKRRNEINELFQNRFRRLAGNSRNGYFMAVGETIRKHNVEFDRTVNESQVEQIVDEVFNN